MALRRSGVGRSIFYVFGRGWGWEGPLGDLLGIPESPGNRGYLFFSASASPFSVLPICTYILRRGERGGDADWRFRTTRGATSVYVQPRGASIGCEPTKRTLHQNKTRCVNRYKILIQKNKNHTSTRTPSLHIARFSSCEPRNHTSSIPAHRGRAIVETNNHPTMNRFMGALASAWPYRGDAISIIQTLMLSNTSNRRTVCDSL